MKEGDKFTHNNRRYEVYGFTYYRYGSKTRKGTDSLAEARKYSLPKDHDKIQVRTKCGKTIKITEL